ncbi:hypothetical protein ACLOJK_016335 [Asimina triloba]
MKLPFKSLPARDFPVRVKRDWLQQSPSQEDGESKSEEFGGGLEKEWGLEEKQHAHSEEIIRNIWLAGSSLPAPCRHSLPSTSSLPALDRDSAVEGVVSSISASIRPRKGNLIKGEAEDQHLELSSGRV